eukprot:m.9319 g.9319  ORF g.9319 m.9319 type:complete len:433 (-) comp5706_c0_seq1:124-1422(-)
MTSWPVHFLRLSLAARRSSPVLRRHLACSCSPASASVATMSWLFTNDGLQVPRYSLRPQVISASCTTASSLSISRSSGSRSFSIRRLSGSRSNSGDHEMKRISVCRFFRLQDHPEHLHSALSYTTAECKTLAFQGDALLGYIVSNQLVKEHGNAVGILTLRKAEYAQNQTMATFLLSFTDLSDRLADLDTKNPHTIGTIFEALLQQTRKLHGLLEAEQVVLAYRKVVDENRDRFTFADPSVSAALSETTTIDGALTTQEKKDGQESSASDDETTESNDSEGETGMMIRPSSAANFLSYDSDDEVQESSKTHTHVGEVVKVYWYSRKGYQYTVHRYSCCGVKASDPHCLRNSWPDPDAKHPGELVIGGSRRSGGGEPQWANNHIPKGRPAHWSCCHQSSTHPGCTSSRYSAERYRALLDSWKEKHKNYQEADG